MASEYGWIITQDVLDGETVAIVGPSDIRADFEARLRKGEGEAFCLYDDDGNLYYSGKIIGDYTGFEPMDDYGGPSAGCTDVKMINPKTKKWETL